MVSRVACTLCWDAREIWLGVQPFDLKTGDVWTTEPRMDWVGKECWWEDELADRKVQGEVKQGESLELPFG